MNVAMNDLDTVSISSGSFTMGSPGNEKDRSENEGPQHEVTIPALECMVYPVTRRLYTAIVGEDPTQRWFEFSRRAGQSTTHWNNEPDALPVIFVRWLEAIEFCNALSRSKGLAVCYVISGQPDVVATRDATVDWNRAATGYRLPTEAEWEFLCRAATTTRWSHGEDEAGLGRHAWYRDNAGGRPHAVGEKFPNPWGLFDMHGNVYELCYDAPREYTSAHTHHPVGAISIHRALRGGGGVAAPAAALRFAARSSIVRTTPSPSVGFRCVRGASES